MTPSTSATPRRVVLLGATGSIGRQACDVLARFPDHFELVAAVARRDAEGLRRIGEQFGISRLALTEPEGEVPAGWGSGMDAACEIAALDCDVVCVAITGAAALRPTLAALDAGNDVATATKEVLVMAGELVTARARAAGARILPIDSEHSALWQCLRGEEPATVERLVLTASGGPFRTRPLETFASITVEEALQHPTWKMGPKVTIDSATMMNKGLEIIEAHFLFDVPYSRIEVAIHPTSTIHSWVEFCDGATIAQIGMPDMRLPIALALADGRRLPGVAPRCELRGGPSLVLEQIDADRYPAVALARAAGERGGVAPAVLNAANEVVVARFLDGGLRFQEIVPIVAETIDTVTGATSPDLDDVIAANAQARDVAARLAAATVSA